MKISAESKIIDGIPTLQITKAGAEKLPVIVYIPGYGSTKEAGLNLGYCLAEEGFFFVSFDPLYHGERYHRQLDHSADPELGGIYPPEMGMDTCFTMFKVIHQCLADTRTLLDHLSVDPRTNTESCGVAGVSMGGYAAHLVFANLTQMKAAVPMIGIPNFSKRWEDLLDECAYSNPDWALAIEKTKSETAERTNFVAKIDPYQKIKQAAQRALLMMNCDLDYDQPKLYSIYAYREFLPYYKSAPENLRLRIYPAGHQVTPKMEEDAVIWFCKHLLAED